MSLKNKILNFVLPYYYYTAMSIKDTANNFFNGLYQPYIEEERDRLGINGLFGRGINLPMAELEPEELAKTLETLKYREMTKTE